MDSDEKKAAVLQQMMKDAPDKGKLTWKSALFFALSALYVISPIDLLPDAIPGIGQTDDIGVIILNLFYIYRLYKTGKNIK